MNDLVGQPVGQLAAPHQAGRILGYLHMAGVVGGDELDERRRPSQRAVDAGLVRPYNRIHDGLILDTDTHIEQPAPTRYTFDDGHRRPGRLSSEIHSYGHTPPP
jgi:hypothetical protein